MISEIFSSLLAPFVQFLNLTWWFWLFLILFGFARSAWVGWRQQKFQNEIDWILLEMRIPREILKSPRAMEQVLAAMHGLRNVRGDLQEHYWDGEVTRWFSLEIVSFGGDTHYYIRCYKKQRGLVEAAFFSYYPDLELVEVEDYVTRLPESVAELEERGYNLWGSEMVLNREDAYPIKTYEEFESMEEEKQFDPMSSFLELLSQIKANDFVGIQFLAAPADPNWRKESNKLLEKLKETKAQKEKVTTPEGQLDAFTRFMTRSPGETDVLKAVENNLSKPGFEMVIRFIYVSPKPTFYDSFARRGLTGAFNQFVAYDLNSLVRNEKMSTRVKAWFFPYVFPNRRNQYRKARILHSYRSREFDKETFMDKLMASYFLNWDFHSKTFVMNTECLATLFHPPTAVVLTAPHVKRVESRKATPPAGMAIFGEEKDIEKFQ